MAKPASDAIYQGHSTANMPLVHLEQLLSVFMRNTALGKTAIEAHMTCLVVKSQIHGL